MPEAGGSVRQSVRALAEAVLASPGHADPALRSAAYRRAADLAGIPATAAADPSPPAALAARPDLLALGKDLPLVLGMVCILFNPLRLLIVNKVSVFKEEITDASCLLGTLLCMGFVILF